MEVSATVASFYGMGNEIGFTATKKFFHHAGSVFLIKT